METFISTVLRGETLKHVETVINNKKDMRGRKNANRKDKTVFNLVPKLRHLRARENAKKAEIKCAC